MRIGIQVYAYGFGSLALILGFVLLALSYNYTKDPTAIQQEQAAGWAFVVIGVIAWIAGFAKSAFSKGRRGFGH